MNRKEYFIIVCNNHFLFIDKKTKIQTEIKLPIVPMPYTPFYHYLFDIKTEKGERFDDIILKELGLNAKLVKIFDKIDVVLLVPDDSLLIDRKILTEYFYVQMAAKKVTIAVQSLLLGGFTENFIAISQTKRVYSFTYIKQGFVAVQKFFDVMEFDFKNAEKEIQNLHADCIYERFPIFINGVEQSNIPSSLGTVVTKELFIQNIYDVFELSEKNKRKNNQLFN